MSRGVPFRAVVRSEWVKLRSVRSTWWVTAVYALVAGGVGWLSAATTQVAADAEDALHTVLLGFGFGQLALVVLGVLSVSAEFASGSAQVTLTTVPRRTRLLAAKTLVVSGYAVVLTLVLALVCALAARTLTAVPGGVGPGDPAVWHMIGLQVGAAGLVTVLSVALGAVLRSTAGGVGLGIALVLLLPPVFALVGGRTGRQISQALPALRVGSDPFLAVGTDWPVGMATVAAWAVAGWIVGAVLLERRDV